MPAYAIAHLRSVDVNADIVEYLERIDATLQPYDGRFVVHGGEMTVLEGEFPGNIVVIEFGDRAGAEAWYASPAYQDILPLRTRNSDGAAVIVDGVGPGHRAPEVIAA